MDDEQAYRDNPFVSLHVVKTHGCARQLQGQVWCWGQSDDGALGLGPVGVGSATTPQQLMRPDNQPLIASGFWTGPTNSCAAVDDRYYCWGAADLLGTPVDVQRNQIDLNDPVQDNNGNPIAAGDSVALGPAHACAVDSLGRAYCWGHGNEYSLGTPGLNNFNATAHRVSLPPNPPQFVQVYTMATRSSFSDRTITCARATDAKLWCWGRSMTGLLGDTWNSTSPEPLAVAEVERVEDLVLTESKACAIQSDDALICWGTDRFFDQESGTSHQPLRPVTLALSLRQAPPQFTSVQLGAYFGLATAETNGRHSAYIWGIAPTGTPSGNRPRLVPVTAGGFLPVAEADAGGR